MMKTDSSKRCVIKIATQEQHDNMKNTRKGLKVLQHAASDKENLVGRNMDQKGKMELKEKDFEKSDAKRKKIQHKSIQTGECQITESDLTSDEPSDDYWRMLAEKRGAALNDSFKENEKLKDQIDVLKEENKVCKDMLDESKSLIEVLQEMLSESEGETTAEIGEEALED